MTKPKLGDNVKVHYTGTLDDGTTFDSSIDREPLEFTIGEGKVLPDFERVVLELNPGERKTTWIPADRAYGHYYDEIVLVVSKSELPEDLRPDLGEMVEMTHQDGRRVIARVIDISESSITFDGNHLLAGKDLTFEIQLVGII